MPEAGHSLEAGDRTNFETAKNGAPEGTPPSSHERRERSAVVPIEVLATGALDRP